MISKHIVDFKRDKIGGSDIAAILGKCRYSGKLSVAQRLLGQAKKKSHEYNPCFEFGNRFEKMVHELFSENHPEYTVVTLDQLVEANALSRLTGFNGKLVTMPDGSHTLVDHEFDFIVLNTDYFILTNNPQIWGILEIKTASEYVSDHWGPTGTDDIPEYYDDQPRFYQSRLGASFSVVAALIGQRDYREYPLKDYTLDETCHVIDTVVDFYNRHIVNKEPVPAKVVDFKKAEIVEKELVANQELSNVIAEYRLLVDNVKHLKAAEKKLEDKIRGAGAQYEKIVDSDGEVLFQNKETTSKKFDVERLKRERPDIYAKYLYNNVSKRFSKGKAFKRAI